MSDQKTQVVRDGHPRQCTSTARTTGRRCTQFAVHGTTVCKMHGGLSPHVLAAAKRRQAEAAAEALMGQVWDLDAAPINNPVEAMQKMAGQVQHALNVLGAKVEVTELDGPAAIAWTRVMREGRQLLVDMARLGIAERHLQLEQERANVVVAAFLAALDVAGLAPGVRSLAVERFLERLGDLVPSETSGGDVVRGEVEA